MSVQNIEAAARHRLITDSAARIRHNAEKHGVSLETAALLVSDPCWLGDYLTSETVREVAQAITSQAVADRVAELRAKHGTPIPAGTATAESSPRQAFAAPIPADMIDRAAQSIAHLRGGDPLDYRADAGLALEAALAGQVWPPQHPETTSGSTVER